MFLLLTVAFYPRALRWRRTADRAGLLLAFPLLLSSKLSHAVAGCILPAGILMTAGLSGAGWKWTVAFAAACVAALLAIPAGTPWDYAPVSASNVIFYGLLPRSTNVHADLVELGLDDTYRQCINYNAFGTPQMNDPTFVKTFATRTGFCYVVSSLDQAGGSGSRSAILTKARARANPSKAMRLRCEAASKAGCSPIVPSRTSATSSPF